MDEERPDIIGMQEIKTNDKAGKGAVDMSQHVGEGYHAYWSHASKPGYSGMLVLSRWPALSGMICLYVRMGLFQHLTDDAAVLSTMPIEVCNTCV